MCVLSHLRDSNKHSTNSKLNRILVIYTINAATGSLVTSISGHSALYKGLDGLFFSCRFYINLFSFNWNGQSCSIIYECTFYT